MRLLKHYAGITKVHIVYSTVGLIMFMIHLYNEEALLQIIDTPTNTCIMYMYMYMYMCRLYSRVTRVSLASHMWARWYSHASAQAVTHVCSL